MIFRSRDEINQYLRKTQKGQGLGANGNQQQKNIVIVTPELQVVRQKDFGNYLSNKLNRQKPNIREGEDAISYQNRIIIPEVHRPYTSNQFQQTRQHPNQMHQLLNNEEEILIQSEKEQESVHYFSSSISQMQVISSQESCEKEKAQRKRKGNRSKSPYQRIKKK